MFRISSVLAAAIVLTFSFVLIASTANLDCMDSILDLTTGYYPQALQLSSNAIPGLTEPDYSGTPMYATLTLGEARFALVIDQDGDNGRLYADVDASKSLVPIDWIQQLYDGGFLGYAAFTIPTDSGTRQYSMFFVWNPSTPIAIIYFRDCYMAGQIELDGITYKMAVIDENSDGLFDDLDHDQLLIDIDQDGELLASQDSRERYWLDAPFNIHGTVYEATSVSPDGSTITIDETDKWVDEKLPLAVGYPAPDFSVKDADGNDLSLSSLKGRVVLLDFWASWCAPCREELPNVEQAYKDYADRGLVVVGIDLDRNEGAFTGAVSYFGLTYPQVFDGANNKVSGLYRVTGIPMSYLIDREGIIRGRSLRGDGLKAAIGKLIDEK